MLGVVAAAAVVVVVGSVVIVRVVTIMVIGASAGGGNMEGRNNCCDVGGDLSNTNSSNNIQSTSRTWLSSIMLADPYEDEEDTSEEGMRSSGRSRKPYRLKPPKFTIFGSSGRSLRTFLSVLFASCESILVISTHGL